MKTIRIALIGTGGIGFRHFQSLLELTRSTELYVIDVSEEAINKDQEYEKEINNKYINVLYGDSVKILPSEIDIAIIATSSLVRKKIFEEVVANTTVEYILFEKFLFPREKDYYEVKKEIEKRGIVAYVNCTSRLYPGYNQLKTEIDKSKGLTMFVTGSNWGLACNAIHDVDVVGYLLDTYDELSCEGSLLDDIIQESKRMNYIEFTGKLMCRLGKNAKIIFESASAGNLPYEITIVNGERIFVISENEQTIYCSYNNEVVKKEFPIFFQSQLTSKIVNQLMSTGKCDLTRYEETCQWHSALLSVFLEKYNVVRSSNEDLCPIT